MINFINSPYLPLIIRDLKERYVGTYIGIMWALIQPGVTLVIMWMVFSVGFKVRAGSGIGFMEWAIPGYICWQYFSEAVSGSTVSVVSSSYLVKKIVFEVEKIPLVKLLTALTVHMFFVMAMQVVVGETPLVKRLQLVYYIMAVSALSYGVGMLTGALSVFSRDVIQVVNMILQLGFWVTPIFWSEEILPEEYRWVAGLNPLTYVVEGYRQSMLGGQWFWERPETIYYWTVTLIMIWIGRRVFRKLRPHFADVL